jgi:hypothetical protein
MNILIIILSFIAFLTNVVSMFACAIGDNVYVCIFDLEYINFIGKIIISILVTPFVVIGTLIFYIAIGITIGISFLVQGFCLLFATNKSQLNRQFKHWRRNNFF